jgi:REP element-mobilizing transposase RayT
MYTMARRLRLLDTEGGVVEVTSRTVHGRFLLRPSPEVNDIILGVLGRAQRLFPVDLFAFVFLANHFHLLMRVLSALRMSQFTGYLKGNLAKELGRLHDWREKFWGRRYHSASIADSESAQEKHFKYILSNGCKEGLVDSPLEWPGVTSAPALVRGETTLEGHWYDRTAQYRARRGGERKIVTSVETVRLSPLPYLEGLSADERRQYMEDAVRDVEEQTREQRAEEKRPSLGVPAILKRDPHDKPESFQRSPAPLFHASTLEEYLAMKEARETITAAYRHAAERLRRGEDNVRFPEGTFPPPQPFVQMRAPP